jgi:hypothetical protein
MRACDSVCAYDTHTIHMPSHVHNHAVKCSATRRPSTSSHFHHEQGDALHALLRRLRALHPRHDSPLLQGPEGTLTLTTMASDWQQSRDST